MKEYRQEPGGRRVKGNDLEAIQAVALMGERFFSQYDNFILAGCNVAGNTISSGIVMLNGKACIFEGISAATLPFYVKYAVDTENVPYETGTGIGIGYEIFKAAPATVGESNAFRLDNAPRFADVFKPKNANYAVNASNADTVDSKHAADFMQQPQLLPAYTNLNNITTPNFYYCNSNADADTMSNLPVKFAFSLLVERHDGVKQTFTMYDMNTPTTWVRNSNWDKTLWGAWKNVTDGGNADTVDGKHAADFAPAGFGLGTFAELLPDGTNINSVYKSGFYRGASIENRPIDGWTYYIVVSHAQQWVTQLAICSGSNGVGNQIFSRVCIDGVWSAWQKMPAAADIVPKIAVYNTSQDPNLTTVPVLLSSHANCPTSELYYICTLFYENTNSSKFQIAYKYYDGVVAFMRNKYLSGGAWTAWQRVVMAEANGDIIAFKI